MWHVFCSKIRASEFGARSELEAIGFWLGSRQAALVPQLFDDDIISGNDADIGMHHKELLLVDLPLCALVLARFWISVRLWVFYLNSHQCALRFGFLYRNFWKNVA